MSIEDDILQIIAEQGTVTLNKVFYTALAREPLLFLGDAGMARVVREMEALARAGQFEGLGAASFPAPRTKTRTGDDVALRGRNCNR